MKKIIPVMLVLLLLLSACGGKKPEQTNPTGGADVPQITETQTPTDSEGVLDPTTEIRYLLVKMIVTNDLGQELWGRDYTYDENGFCTQEREYSNIGAAPYSRVNAPDALGRIGTSTYTEADGSQYTITYTYDELDRCIREDVLRESGERERLEYSYNEQGNYLTLKQYIDDQLVVDYSFSYTYDGKGNQVSMDEYLFGELMNHVATVYDADGRELATTTTLVNGEIMSRTESQWDGLTETRLYFSGDETEPFMVSVFTYDDQGNVVFEETSQSGMILNRSEYIYEPFEVKK